MLDRVRSLRGYVVMMEAWNRAPLLWSMVGTVLTFILWASLFQLDVASYAQGQVIPAGQLKKIQHLEGGIIRSIEVVEGQQVEAGKALVELEDVASDADASDLRSRAASLEIKSLRLMANLERQAELKLPAELEQSFPDSARDGRSAFNAYRSRYNAMVQTHESKAAQRRAEILEARERLAGLQKRSQIIGQQVKISEDLLKQDLSNEYEHLQLKKEQSQIESDRKGTIANEQRAVKAFEEGEAAFDAFRHEEDVGLRKDLLDTNTELASVRERLRKPADSHDRTLVRTSVSGTILTLFFKNKGAVVPPGGTIATLVPEGEALLVEAKLPISEIGYVGIGAKARLSIASGGNGYSTIAATVVHISPDSLSDEKTGAPAQGGAAGGMSYYIVRLAPKELAFRRGNDSYALRPGVQVMSAIITGERSVMALLLEPFVGSGVRPLTER
ncbi:HlyD family type I secretion periplasmic adaptor subunit [Magnetospirillum moscoviense]|uniref:HlyD family type I secretion periplasmic adaptor subunit n=1 Tax=Magnetospirillum moscoviense TaxID=1437059 RepID=UPI001561301F|nr:HlyD family type I secretion periplasmic adaptor subunit [Magnetospirillum moscoviense]